MKYLLDTNICIYYIKGTYPKIRQKLLSYSPEIIGIPIMTKAELLLGAEKSMNREQNLQIINEFLFPFQVYGFNHKEAQAYVSIRAQLEKSGKPIGPNDLIIASIAIAYNATLVTHNTKEFSRVDGLSIEDWTI